MFSVGLTGGIGCGKSTVATLFARLGAGIIDTDLIAHTLTQKDGLAYPQVVRIFGRDFLLSDGNLNRARLRHLIFSDALAKETLEAILHPLILNEVQTALRLCSAPYAIIVVPLLFETRHYLRMIQRSLVVDCSEDSQIARTCARSALTPAEVKAIMAHQVTREMRLREAHDIIRNDSDEAGLSAQVEHLHLRYLDFSTSPKS